MFPRHVNIYLLRCDPVVPVVPVVPTFCSQEELAKKAGITYSTLIKLETGANDNPTIKTLMKIADALGVSVGHLINKKL